MSEAILEFKSCSIDSQPKDRRILLDLEKSCPFIEVTDKKCICKAIYLNAYASRYPELTYYDLLKCSTIWESCPNFKIEKNFLENHK